MSRTKSSKRWLKAHFSDVYVKRAQEEGYRSRAAFKLFDIQAKDKLIKPGMTVVDLGAAPGSWAQVVSQIVAKQGRVFALDILLMEPLAQVTFVQGDFREDNILQILLDSLGGAGVDLVLSDMAPNISGMAAVDLPRAMYLAEIALDFAKQVLNPGGSFVVKVFQGVGFDEFLKECRHTFKRVVTRKPAASRPHSRELYIVGFKFIVPGRHRQSTVTL